MLDKKIIKKLIKIFGKENVRTSPRELILYQYDASLDRALPDAVVLPENTEQIVALLKMCQPLKIPVIARGSGSNLSGGTVPVWGGIIVHFARMNRILEIDSENLCAVVEPGVYNLDLQQALEPYDLYFAPDPASQRVSTIGGNIAENAGGPHCLKYGVTSNHILGLEVVTADGTVLTLGGKMKQAPGYDLMGLIIGSEGTLGIVTKAIVNLLRRPETVKTMLAIFDSMEQAAEAVTGIISQGIIPATLEMLDKPIIETVEQIHHLGYPEDADAVLLLELDGPATGMEDQVQQIVEICKKFGARKLETAKSTEHRDTLWQGRRLSFGSLTKLKPSVMIADGTVPRSKVPEVLKKVKQICAKHNVKVGNVFHAGDGNLHPFIVFDESEPQQKEKVMQANEEILSACIEAGGTISGEHGIGLEKKSAMRLLFSADDLHAMISVKKVFDRAGILNPNKIFPTIEVDNI